MEERITHIVGNRIEKTVAKLKPEEQDYFINHMIIKIEQGLKEWELIKFAGERELKREK